MILKTKRLLLRPWVDSDEAQLYELAKDPHVGPPCGWEPHEDRQESREILEDILMNDFTFAIELVETGEVIGNISLMPYSESRFAMGENQAEIGFWLGFPYWGKGYMTEACDRLVAYGLEELKLDIIWCGHNPDNIASMHVQQKCGFEFHHEDSMYSKEKDERIKVVVNNIHNKCERG